MRNAVVKTSVSKTFKAQSGPATKWHRNQPIVAETVAPNIPLKDRDWTIQSESLKRRVVRLDGYVDENAAAIVNASIRYLESIDPKAPIDFIINSEGGNTSDGSSIIGTMMNCFCPIHTYVYGLAASMAADIFVCGDKRYAAPYAEIMIHQPLGGTEGQQTDIEIYSHNIKKLRERFTTLYVERTGMTARDVEQLIERDYSMTAEEAKELGIVDEILTQEAYFKKVYNMAVPEYKKPRYAPPKFEHKRKPVSDYFNEIAGRAQKNRKVQIEKAAAKKPARKPTAKPAPKKK